MDYNTELEKINELIDKIGEVAERDGTISNKEQVILDAIFNDLSEYRRLVLDALEDGKVTDEELQSMADFREKILNNASNTALADGDYTDDEKSLVDSLIDFVEDR